MKRILIAILLFISMGTIFLNRPLSLQADVGELTIIYDNPSSITSISDELTQYETAGWEILRLDRSANDFDTEL